MCQNSTTIRAFRRSSLQRLNHLVILRLCVFLFYKMSRENMNWDIYIYYCIILSFFSLDIKLNLRHRKPLFCQWNERQMSIFSLLIYFIFYFFVLFYERNIPFYYDGQKNPRPAERSPCLVIQSNIFNFKFPSLLNSPALSYNNKRTNTWN